MRKKPFRAKTKDEKTGNYGSEKNCVRVCLFYILNKQVQRKDSVEIRKSIDSNDKSLQRGLVSSVIVLVARLLATLSVLF
jgi:hypothetical protein